MYTADILTVPASICGLSGLSVPAGFSKDNLPIGMQIIANQYMEENLFAVGNAFEKATEWSSKKPTL